MRYFRLKQKIVAICAMEMTEAISMPYASTSFDPAKLCPSGKFKYLQAWRLLLSQPRLIKNICPSRHFPTTASST
jgi:hypothetical protein